MKKHIVYILESDRNRHYIGYTANLPQRIAQHNRKHKGFTGTKETWGILCFAGFDDKKEAMEFEQKLKSLKDYRLAMDYINRISVVEHSG